MQPTEENEFELSSAPDDAASVLDEVFSEDVFSEGEAIAKDESIFEDDAIVILDDEDLGAIPIADEAFDLDAADPGLDENLLLQIAELEIDEELSEESAERRIFSLRRLYAVIGLCVATLLSMLLYVGWSYYWLPMSERPLHHFHEALRPSGVLGLCLGAAGTVIMVFSLAYLVRKRFLHWAWLGSVKNWMGLHIFTGIIGPALIIFHAAFRPSSSTGALAFVAMLVVLASGFLGRYILVYFPRSLEGRQMEREALRRRLEIYRKKLVDMGIDPALLRLDESGGERKTWFLLSIVRVFLGDRESRREFNNLRVASWREGHSDDEVDTILRLMRRLCREHQSLVRYEELRGLMTAWRFLHRWLAIVMFLAAFFHIAVGARFGSLWIFGGGR